MPDSPTRLDDLRRQIDEIDDRLHDLVMRRTEIVEAISQEKRNGNLPALRPGREALILRRLLAHHSGNFPAAALVRMWREMLSATVGLQTKFAVAVYCPDATSGYWDLARDHFGSNTPVTPFRSAGQVMRALSDGQATIGILPMPREDDPDPWWRFMLSSGESAPRILARLPFAASQISRPEGDALAVGSGTLEPTGDDRSLVVIETRGNASRTRFFTALTDAGLPCSFLASFAAGEEVCLTLIEIEAFVLPDDPRLGRFVEQLGGIAVERLVPLGSYAMPVALRWSESEPVRTARS